VRPDVARIRAEKGEVGESSLDKRVLRLPRYDAQRNVNRTQMLAHHVVKPQLRECAPQLGYPSDTPCPNNTPIRQILQRLVLQPLTHDERIPWILPLEHTSHLAPLLQRRRNILERVND
jgi:hypothetical protein